MSLTIAALVYRPSEISDRALSLGFAVALGGWDVPAPRLEIAGLPELPGFAVAFYASGAKREDEAEHTATLFEEELSPPVAVLDAVEALSRNGAAAGERSPVTLYALVYAEDFVHDDGWRFGASGFERHFVRDGDDGIEVGVETPDDSDVQTLDLDIPEDVTEAEEQALFDAALRPHRGTTFLGGALGKGLLPVLVRASFEVERTVAIRFVEPDPASIRAEAERLVKVLGRCEGRGAFSPPKTASGAPAPAAITAFAAAYDWQDPRDPEDLYRELAIGAVTGNLRFLREAEMASFRAEPGWVSAKGEALFPVAKLVPSALGGGRAEATILAVPPSGEALFVLRPGRRAESAGPAFGELLRYLSLGWSKRTDAEEDLIGALMLRARLRVENARRR
jgi:hypothetical protein